MLEEEDLVQLLMTSLLGNFVPSPSYVSAYCDNCGSGSHCGTGHYREYKDYACDGIEYRQIKVCDHCRCKVCSGNQCHKCKEKVLDAKLVDYRDYQMKLRGQVWHCKNCIEE